MYDDDEVEEKVSSGELNLRELWEEFPYTRHALKRENFLAFLRETVSDPEEIETVEFCDWCQWPEWDDDMQSGKGGALRICDTCWQDWTDCDSCDERYPYGDLTATLGDSSVCEICLSERYSYCEHCEGYYHDDDACDHDHDDDGCCDSPQYSFTIRNDGCDPLDNDTRVTVTLPAGTISDEGIKAIRNHVYRYGYYDLSYGLAEELGDQWQTKTGNYTKRLSRLAAVKFGNKLSPEILSQVGVIAREHSMQTSLDVETTRALNMSDEEFCNEGSCWWGSYSESRCALKTNGGFGLRSFDEDGAHGRAWVMPLKKDLYGELHPTFNTLTPDAFIVFNGYGKLSGYAAPRILAHMAGWTYRKIGFSCPPMYVNAGGYLVAPEDIAEKYTDGVLNLSVRQHSDLYTTENGLVNA